MDFPRLRLRLRLQLETHVEIDSVQEVILGLLCGSVTLRNTGISEYTFSLLAEWLSILSEVLRGPDCKPARVSCFGCEERTASALE